MRGLASFGGGNLAGYPSNGYPAVDFAGAGNISPRTGGVGGASTMASGTGAAALLPASIAKNTPLAIILVVLAGYAIWHISSRI